MSGLYRFNKFLLESWVIIQLLGNLFNLRQGDFGLQRSYLWVQQRDLPLACLLLAIKSSWHVVLESFLEKCHLRILLKVVLCRLENFSCLLDKLLVGFLSLLQISEEKLFHGIDWALHFHALPIVSFFLVH